MRVALFALVAVAGGVPVTRQQDAPTPAADTALIRTLTSDAIDILGPDEVNATTTTTHTIGPDKVNGTRNATARQQRAEKVSLFGFSSITDAISDTVSSVGDAVSDVASDVGDAASAVASGNISGAVGAVADAAGSAAGAATDVANAAASAVTGGCGIPGVGAITDAAGDAMDAASDVAGAITDIASPIKAVFAAGSLLPGLGTFMELGGCLDSKLSGGAFNFESQISSLLSNANGITAIGTSAYSAMLKPLLQGITSGGLDAIVGTLVNASSPVLLKRIQSGAGSAPAAPSRSATSLFASLEPELPSVAAASSLAPEPSVAAASSLFPSLAIEPSPSPQPMAESSSTKDQAAAVVAMAGEVVTDMISAVMGVVNQTASKVPPLAPISCLME